MALWVSVLNVYYPILLEMYMMKERRGGGGGTFNCTRIRQIGFLTEQEIGEVDTCKYIYTYMYMSIVCNKCGG